ncbi:MAG: hypothetical protein RBS43_04670 [Candidatus Cloacimonas sp.]|nr:hypothetical protein [Candidatus Cloacimonas sp.]
MNPIRDDTNKALQYRHLSSILTELINGLDSRLRRNDKRFRTSSSAGMTKRFRPSSEIGVPICNRNNTATFRNETLHPSNIL